MASLPRPHLQAKRPRFESDPATRRVVTETFLAATTTGDVATLMDALAPGIELMADGGGKVRAPRLQVRGAAAITRFLLATSREHAIANAFGLAPGQRLPDIQQRVVNLIGGPAIVAFAGGVPKAVLILDVIDAHLSAVSAVGRPWSLDSAAWQRMRLESIPVPRPGCAPPSTVSANTAAEPAAR